MMVQIGMIVLTQNMFKMEKNKKLVFGSLFFLVVLMSSSVSAWNFGGSPSDTLYLNYTFADFNNSNFLNGYSSSYFYPLGQSMEERKKETKMGGTCPNW